MKLRESFLEFGLAPLLLSNSFKTHTYLIFSLVLEIQKLVGILQLVEVSLDILIVIDILHDLILPLATLLVVHKLLAIQVVEHYTNSGLGIVADVEPQFLNLDALVVHVLSKVNHGDMHHHAVT